jgi:hypothetical protein
VKRLRNISSPTNRKRIEKYVKELSDLERKCRLSHTRDWPFPYLARVYELYMNWRKKRLGKQRRADLDKFVLKRSSRKDKKSLRLLIECTSAANAKTRNKWASALLVARKSKIEARKIPDFLLNKGGGGIAGRVAEHAAQRKRLKKNKKKKTGRIGNGSDRTSSKSIEGNAFRATRSVRKRTENENDDWNSLTSPRW